VTATWDQRHASASAPGEASHVLREYAYLLPVAGSALDIACGLGADSLFLAQHGLDVQAWDSSAVAIDKLRGFARARNLVIDAQCRDVVAQPPPPDCFDVIVVCHFLERALCPAIAAALKPGGMVFYQTFCAERVDPAHGPSSAAFLLQRNELLRLFATLDVVAYHEAGILGDTTRGFRDRALLVARKPANS
jgi:tellurite methyltransferase